MLTLKNSYSSTTSGVAERNRGAARAFGLKFFDRIKDEKRGHILEQKAGIWRKEKVKKSVWGMPGLLEAKKDVVSCEKPRGLANVN